MKSSDLQVSPYVLPLLLCSFLFSPFYQIMVNKDERM